MPLPTFLIMGAQKSGTTTLTATFRQHPQIHMSRPKELHFFDRHPERGLDWYAEQFTPGRRVKQWGEASPVYMYLPETRQAVHEALPDIRLIMILRDPVKRAYSQFWHSKRYGFEPLDSFEEALAREPERLANGGLKPRVRFSYRDRGHYIDQIEDLEARYGRDRMHVMLLDDLMGDRVPTLEKVFRFLRVQTKVAAQLEEKWSKPVPRDKERAQQAAPLEYPPLNAETRAELAEHYREPNARLAAWLGRDLSGWTQP